MFDGKMGLFGNELGSIGKQSPPQFVFLVNCVFLWLNVINDQDNQEKQCTKIIVLSRNHELLFVDLHTGHVSVLYIITTN